MKSKILMVALLTLITLPAICKERVKTVVVTPQSEREYLVKTLTRIADPVLQSLSKGQLKELMPVECAAWQTADRKNYTYLEAFGRTLAGMAP